MIAELEKHIDVLRLYLAAGQTRPMDIEAFKAVIAAAERCEAAESAATLAVEIGQHQANEFDRYWKSAGVLDASVSVDDAIDRFKALQQRAYSAEALCAELKNAAEDVLDFACFASLDDVGKDSPWDRYLDAKKRYKEALAKTPADMGKERIKLDDKASAQKINVRLFDLVRYMRGELLEANLIDDMEYAWLCGICQLAQGGGSPSPRRLEDYDVIKKELAELREDKARLDWLDSEASTDWWHDGAELGEPGELREIIDAARKEGGAK